MKRLEAAHLVATVTVSLSMALSLLPTRSLAEALDGGLAAEEAAQEPTAEVIPAPGGKAPVEADEAGADVDADATPDDEEVDDAAAVNQDDSLEKTETGIEQPTSSDDSVVDAVVGADGGESAEAASDDEIVAQDVSDSIRTR